MQIFVRGIKKQMRLMCEGLHRAGLLAPRCFSVAVAIVMAMAMTVTAGCGGVFQQDPYSDQSESIRNGIPPEQKPRPPTPTPTPPPTKALSANALRIDSPDFYSFKEGVQSDITLAGRVLDVVEGKPAEYGVDYELLIENLNELPGASFDARKGIFSWKPPMDFVSSEYSRNVRLNVALITNTQPRIATRKSILLYVQRDEVEPEIVDVIWPTGDFFREGQGDVRFQVIVKDPDALDYNNGRPRLLVVADSRYRNLSSLIYQADTGSREPNPVLDKKNKDHWIFTMVMDLGRKELTKADEVFTFGLIAVNRFGRSSTPRTVSTRIRTSVTPALSSWREPLRLISGLHHTITFAVFDPKEEGNLTAFIDNCNLLPGVSECKCVRAGGDGRQSCTLQWMIPSVSVETRHIIKGNFVNRSPVNGDSEVAAGEFSFEVRALPDPNAPVPPASSVPPSEPETENGGQP